MRRKHLILASCIISALLLTFTFHVSADENVEVDAGASSNSAPLLDSYFWENYTLLPYIESNRQQYIDTGVYLNNNCDVHLQFSPLDYESINGLFGSYSPSSNKYYGYFTIENNKIRFIYDVYESEYAINFNKYNIYDCVFSDDLYINNNLVYSFDNVQDFTTDYTCYIFGRHESSTAGILGKYRLYTFSIYDNSLNDPNDPDSGEVGYLRYYYPARSKSGDVIGLYDAVSKTFVTTASNTPFTNPTGSDASMGITANITNFLVNGVSWITDILEFAIDEPIIILFMAIGLCGVAFRWARRVVHF